MPMYSVCRCGEKIPYRTKYCDKCKPIIEKEKRRNKILYKRQRTNKFGLSEQQKIYNSKKWRETKASVLDEYKGLCVGCLAKGLLVPATEVHHIVWLSKDISKAYDKDNLISLCYSCHDDIHRLNIDNKDKLESFLEEIKNKN
ncbi:HNH endonuclease signature motif containing protein [Clostridium perfringens]|uniref:HNH endonuclease n=1 Tax=Clostridium perfringens TaxID=1502 RepID=UPI0026E3FA83|nr:HNH endonuclease signature motif containing protein [Clostridium perfringens]MDO6336445.1 HNH endonuclease signature motif containing protein [Clostridium perfringens]